jgi:hypothetical protein
MRRTHAIPAGPEPHLSRCLPTSRPSMNTIAQGEASTLSMPCPLDAGGVLIEFS